MRLSFAFLFRLGLVALTAFQSVSFAQDFKPLFNGKDLSGWVEMGRSGAYVAENGVLVLKKPQNYPNWLRTEKEYENFVLRLEYMATGWCESGIYLHAPLYGDQTQTGVKLHLRHDRTPEAARSTGALYDISAPKTFAHKGINEWNALEIRTDWPRLLVKINDVVVQDVDMDSSDDLRSRARTGYIGLQDIDCPLKYRNIEIRELPDKERKWTRLFNGTDLKGWTKEGKATFEVKDGAIMGSNGDGFLYYDASFSAFEFQVFVRTSPHANGGIYFRHGDGFGGYEIQVYNVPGSTNPTGSIYGIVPANAVPCRDGEWCLIRLVSDGPYTGVWLNGWKVAESKDIERPDKGQVGFQNHSSGRVEHLDPKIRPLR